MLRIETGNMFQVHTTFDVLVETVRVFRRRHPNADGRRPQELFDRLSKNVDEVLGDFPGDIDFDGSDVGDLHVHAATLACRADILLTSNGDDFGEPDLLDYEVSAPDDFFVLIDNSAPHHVRQVARDQVDYWQKRRDSGEVVKSLHDALIDAGCPKFAGRVQRHVRVLSGA